MAKSSPRPVVWLLAVFTLWLLPARAQEKTLVIGGVPLMLQEVTSRTEVYYSAMRFNRASNVWNVEASVRNAGSDTLSGPLVLYVESWTGTGGPLSPDGVDGDKPYFDLAGSLTNNALPVGQASAPRTLTLAFSSGNPQLVTKIYAPVARPSEAIAFVRSLNEVGQPLAGVTVEETGPASSKTNLTDRTGGLATLGGKTGAHLWKFSKAGYFPAWRALSLDTNGIASLPAPRLTPRAPAAMTFTPISGGTLTNGGVALQFGPGSFLENANGALTLLDGQTLPAFLPSGWSPLNAFWFETTSPVQMPGTVALAPSDRLGVTESAALVRWNETSVSWDVLEVRAGAGTNALNFALPAIGAYALVIADSGAFAPPAAVAGQPLAGTALGFTNFTTVTALGTVTPSLSPASPQPELVTAQAEVIFTNAAGPLPSGLLLRTEVSENYELNQQRRRFLPAYENHIVAYQRPSDANAATLTARFPLRPLLLLGADELVQANVHVDVLRPGPFAGAMLDAKGGQLALGPVRILSGVSNLLAPAALRLQLLNPTNFPSVTTNGVLAFELSVGSLPADRRLTVQFTPQATNSFYVLSRVVMQGGLYGLEPVERFVSDGAGRLSSVEPATGNRLPGITGAGQFVLLRMTSPQGLVSGTARDGQGQPLADAAIQLPPWLTFSDAQGAYRLLAPTGTVQIAITDLTTGDSTQREVAMADWQIGVVADLEAAAQPPRVVAVSPAPGTNGVSLVAPIVITFSEPINLGSVLPDGIRLFGASNQPVATTLSFNLKGTVANLLPVDPLASLTVHTIQISPSVADLTGVKLAGSNTFTFTTASDATQRDPGAQIISYEPTNGVMRIRGTPGISEPGKPVILVNETTGFTSTVLAKSDGSFDNGIAAEETDFLSAVFVNANGTRNAIPVSRQLFRDGSVGLFNGGGTIETTNANGVVQVLVEAGAIPGRAKFKVEALATAALPAFVTNVPAGSPQPLGGLKLRISGGALNQSVDVAFPINVADLNLPAGEDPTNATYCLAIPREDVLNGVTNTVYEIIDRMHFENGKLVTHSPPFFGLLPALNLDLLTVPLFMSVGHQMTIAGRVYSAQLDNYGKPVPGTEKNLPGAVVSAVPPGQPQGIPGRLRPGTVMATAGGTNSSYAMMLVVSEAAPAVVTASHPRFPGVAPVAFVPAMSQGERFSLGNFFKPVDVVFPTRDALDLSEPALLFSHAPERPQPGSNGVVKIVATDNASRPQLSVSVAEAVSLAFGTNMPTGQIALGLVQGEDLGAFTRRETWNVSAPVPARVLLTARATDDSGNEVTSAYPIFFGGSEPVATNTIPAPDPNDTTGPRIISSVPSRGVSGFAPGQPVVLRFDEPIDRALLQDATVISLMPGNLRAVPRLSDDQMELTLNFPGMQPGVAYTLTVNSGVRDLSGNRLDQDPIAEGNNSFVLNFTTATLTTGALPGIQSGGGAVLRGIYAYVLDRNTSSNASVGIYDLSNPAAPRRAAQFLLGGGYPRDLVLIPDYSFKRATNGPTVTKDLLAVVGGYTGEGRSQYLRVIDISDPLNPQWEAGIALSRNPEAVVSRVQWSAPYLAYLESGSVNSVGVLDLQTLILFENMETATYLAMPENGFPGVDANGDGDYVDAGDQLPLPASEPVEFASKLFSFTLENSDAWINDFVLGEHGQFVGVVTDAGHRYSENGSPTSEIIPPLYRTLYNNGTFPEAELASYVFTNARPKRVHLMSEFPVVENSQIRLARLALVSVRMNQGFEDGKPNRLGVLDVTLPVAPTFFAEISVPEANGDAIYSVIRREDGMLLLATDKDVLVLDPVKFRSAVGPDGVHPAIVGIIPGAGNAMRTFDGSLAGMNIVGDGTKNQLLLNAPVLQFVQAPTNNPFVPANLVNRTNLAEVLAGFSPVNDLWLARYRAEAGIVPSTLSPPLGVTHYYVLVHAPGSAGPTIDLSLESLNWAGQPLRKQGFLFPPVNAFSPAALNALEQTPLPEEAPVRASKAWRLSSNPASPYYNVYLSRPFALVGEEMSQADLATLQGELDRDVLWSGAYLRASLDPSQKQNVVIGQFAGRISPEDNLHYPGVEVLANSYPADFVQSPNPEPMIGGVTLTDALGVIGAHNGELRAETADMVLPGRRLPIEFRRFNGAQSLYDGPFGRGWDFNYNQRLVELSTRGLAPDAKLPQVVRATAEDSEVAANKDLLFYTGAGRVVVWKYAGTNAPSVVAGDPLVNEVLRWTNKVDRYYLPPTGAFNLMFKFKDGRYARLEPDGTQFWYNTAGRLAKIYDRYDKNSLELVYNQRGELIRIYDELRRALDIGWWRLPTDPLRRAGIDETTLRPNIAGKIGKLLDYSNRDVLFYYTEDGLLQRREGPLVETAAVNGFTGRTVTRYAYSDASQPGRSGKALTGILGGDNSGTPLVAAMELGLQGRDTVSKIKIANGDVKVELGQANTARALSAGNGTAKVTNPDQTTTRYKFDKFGRPLEIGLAAPNTAEQKTVTEYYPNGLLKSVTHPEGNRIEYEYDAANPSFRARANVTKVTKYPGPRGGATLQATTEYDLWYNLPSGVKTDFNTNSATITLRTDHRDTERVTKSGQVETFTANEFGQMERHVGIDGITRQWGFNADGFLRTLSVGPLTTTYGYAPASGVRSDFTLRGLASSVTDPRNITTQFLYDERNQLVRSTRAGQETTYAYDENGNILEVRNKVDDNLTLIEQRTYDQVGFMRAKTLKDVEVEGVPTDIVTTFEPDALRRVKRAIFPGGEVHELEYNQAGQLTNYVIGGSYRESYQYDGNGNCVAQTIGGATESRAFDGHDRLVRVGTPSGTTNYFSYDGNNNLTGKRTVDRDGRVLSEMSATFDALDRPWTETRQRDSGVSTAQYNYNTADRIVTFTDALNAQVQNYYDDAGRIWKEVTPTRTVQTEFDANSNVRRRTTTDAGRTYVEEFDYNDLDQMIEARDNRNHATHYTVGLDGRVKIIHDREGFAITNQYTLLGELVASRDANGVLTQYRHSTNRQVSAISDAAAHTQRTEFDTLNRVKRVILPNQAETTYNNFDAFNSPQTIALPRGYQITAAYNAEGQLTNRVWSGSGANRQERYTYDGLQRLKSVSDPSGSVSFTFDKYGFTKTFAHQYQFAATVSGPTTLAYTVGQEADAGGFRSALTYPGNAVTVANRRDYTGRLLALLPDSGEPVIKTNIYSGDALTAMRELGNGQVRLLAEFDELKRPTVRRFVNASGRALVDVRYAYDNNGAQVARQFVHRGGRADFFQYDPGYRLKRAEVGVRPSVGSAESGRTLPGFATPEGLAGNWSAGGFARTMTYGTTDVLQDITTANPDNLPLAPMTATFGAPDEFLFVPTLDDATRQRDEVGNITVTRLFVRLPGNATPVAVMATNTFNELNQLVRIARADGVVIENEYAPSGLRLRRKVTGDPSRCVPSDTAFLYDGGNLIEERDLLNNAAVKARYYYADDGDELIAGDLSVNGGPLTRHYFLSDVVRSVLGVTDADGALVERVRYDAWGQPILEGVDIASPHIARVLLETNTLLIEFSEPVLPAFQNTDNTTNFVTGLQDANALFEVRVNGSRVTGTVRFEENLPGRLFGSTYRFIPSGTLGGSAQLTLTAGSVQDEANNTNAPVVLNLNLATPGVVFDGVPQGTTAAAQLGRSTIDSPFLFHGQVFDYDTGLVYCRARFYDPSSGMFLSRDPGGYVDGVNQYAGFANNPISLRDPTGNATPEGMDQGEAGEQHSISGYIINTAKQSIDRALDLGTATAQGIDLLNSGNPGSQGALDAMRGADLIISDAQVAAGAAGVLKLGLTSSINLTRRAASMMQKFRSSPQIPAAVREHLIKSGLTQVEIDAIIPAMKKHGVSRLSIRSFGEKRFARQAGVNSGLQQKTVHIKDKTGFDSTITRDGVTYVSDADILHVEINGRPATLKEVQRFAATANRNYTKLWNQRSLGTLGVPANPPFQHGSHLSMAQMYEKGGKVNGQYIRQVGHPGDSFTIRAQGNGNILAYDTPRWKTHQDVLRMGAVLRNRMDVQAVRGVTFPNGTGWPGQGWNTFQKDWVNERQSLFFDPVSQSVDTGKMRRFMNGQ